MSLAVWLPLNGDLHNQGLSGLTPTSSSTVSVSDSGKIGKCYDFNGGYLKITNLTTIPTNSWSLAAWVYPRGDTSSGHQYILGMNTSTSSDFLGVLCYYTNKFGVRTGGTTYTASSTSALNTWYHLAATYDGTTLRLYVNGTEVKTQASPAAPVAATTVYIGTRGGITGNFNGLLNDVRIYSHALSKKEVEEIAKGLVLHYKLDDRFCEPTTNLVAQLIAGGRTTVTNNVVKNTGENADTFWYIKLKEALVGGSTYTVSCICTGFSSANTYISFGVGAQSGTNNAGIWKIYNGYNTFTFTMPSSLNGSTANFIFDDNGGTRTQIFEISNVQLEKKDHATPFAGYGITRTPTAIYDSSGYSHNGTIVGSLTAAAGSPRYDVATHLESSSPTTNNNTGLTYIQSPFGLTAPMQMSVCWWGRPENGYGGTSNHAAWCTSASSGDPTDYNKTAFHHRDSKFDICLDSASSTSLSLTFNNYTLNEWHYYCITYDGKIAILYKDGIETNRSTISSTEAPLKTFTKIVIGFSKAGGVWRKTLGSYSDFRVYATTLAADQVKELYNTSMSIDSNGNIYARELVEL